MKRKSFPVLLALGVLVLVLAACDGAGAGDPNTPGLAAIPGGTLTLPRDVFLTADSRYVICFDTDTTVNDGQEIKIELEIPDPADQGTGEYFSLTWRAVPSPAAGSYYVYGWIDYDASGGINSVGQVNEADTLKIWDAASNGLVIDAGSGISGPQGQPQVPNYTLFSDYAAPLDFVYASFIQEPTP